LFLRSEHNSEEEGEASSLTIQHAPAAGSAIASGGGNWTLLLDRSRSSNSSWADRDNISAPLPRAAAAGSRMGEGSSSLHAFVDNSIVETIADNLTAITARVFPQRGDSTSVMISLQGEQHGRQLRRRRSTVEHPKGASTAIAAAAGESDGSCTITASFSVWALAAAANEWG